MVIFGIHIEKLETRQSCSLNVWRYLIMQATTLECGNVNVNSI